MTYGKTGDELVPLRRRFRPGSGSAAETALERKAIARAKDGDWDAIHYLYVRYHEDVRAYIASIVRNEHDAEDVAQSLFARLMTAIQRYEPRDVAFAGWLMRVARNASLDFLRTKRQIPVEQVHRRDTGGHANAECRQSLLEAFEELPSDQRTVMMMRHVVGLSPTEIAERLDKSEGSVHGLHHRGRRALQSSLRSMELGPAARRGA